MKIFIAAICAIFLLSGCTSKWAYNNVDWLLYWYVDDYIDLERSQKKLLDVKVEEWHQWHRESELVQYKEQLLDLQKRINQGNLSAQEWRAEFKKASGHWQRFRDHIVPELSVLAVETSDEQIESLYAALEEENIKEQEERDEETIEERLEDSKKRLKKQLKERLGRLSDEQKLLVDSYIPQFKSTFDYWLAYRRLIQSKSKELMLNRHELADFSAQFSDLLMNPESLRTEEHKAAIEHNSELSGKMLAEIQATLSEKQYKHLNNEIDDLVEDITDLIED